LLRDLRTGIETNLNLPADAMKVLDKLIALSPDPQRWMRKAMFAAQADKVEEALYDRAGPYALRGNKAKALAELKSAVALEPSIGKAEARKDERFKSLWDDPGFKKLTE
jgi:predicted Zn-dependent protease